MLCGYSSLNLLPIKNLNRFQIVSYVIRHAARTNLLQRRITVIGSFFSKYILVGGKAHMKVLSLASVCQVSMASLNETAE